MTTGTFDFVPLTEWSPEQIDRLVRDIAAAPPTFAEFCARVESAPEPDAETLAATDAGIATAMDELGIVRQIALDNEVRDRCYED